MGIKDFVPDAINQLGKPGVVVQGISLRPGAVSGFGIINANRLLCCQGTLDLASQVSIFLSLPLIRRYCGLKATACNHD